MSDDLVKRLHDLHSDDLVKRLHDLHKQATVERSHFYVGKCVADAIHRIEELEALRDALTNKIHKLVFLLDDQLGTPCEQIRHQQQVEKLKGKLDKTVEMLRVLGVHPIVLAELKGDK